VRGPAHAGGGISRASRYTAGMRRRAAVGWVAGLVVFGLVGGASVFGEQREDDEALPEFSAERLGDLEEHDSILDMLEPEEREAVERSGMSLGSEPGASPEGTQGPFGPETRQQQGRSEGTLDKIGKIGVSVLGVALSLAAVAAPFFMAF
jgi:hypothetical protein